MMSMIHHDDSMPAIVMEREIKHVRDSEEESEVPPLIEGLLHPFFNTLE